MLIIKEELISGIHTEMITYETKSNLRIIIIPGNPGIASFYSEFANQIIQRTNGNCSIYIISYAGFTKRQPDRKYSLSEEFEHKVAVVNHLITKWSKKSKVVFIGHSIGAWITKELVKKFQKELKPIAFLLFPFIAKSEIKIQEKFSKLIENKKQNQFILGSYKIFRKLPHSMITPLIKILYSHVSENANDIIQEYFLSKNHIPESIFYLGKTEFNTLSHNVDLDYLKSHKKSNILFYCHDDIWAPISQLEFIQDNIKEIRSEIFPLITHDFCVNTDQSKIIADKVLEYLGK